MLVCFAAVAFSFSAAPLFAWKDPTPAEKQMTEDPDKGISGAVYLEKKFDTAGTSCQVTVRAKIFSRAGFDVATVNDLSVGAYQIDGRTIGPSGKITKLASQDIRSVTALKAGGRSYIRKSFTLPGLEPGCIIEYSYREPDAFGSLGEAFVEIPFQDKYTVLHQEVRTPNPFPYTCTARLQNTVQIQRSDTGSSHLYQASGAPPVVAEPDGLPAGVRSAGLIFSYVYGDLLPQKPEEFWKEAGKLLGPYLRKRLVRAGRVKSQLAAIPGDRQHDPEGRLRNLYRFVQSRIVNREALPAGTASPAGGWKTNDDAGDALDRASGSPFDLAAVFATLLRADGWSYRFVGSTDHSRHVFFPGVPSIFQFDSWIVEAKDPSRPDRVYDFCFDNPKLPFAMVPWSYTGSSSFAVDPETGAEGFVTMEPSKADQNVRRADWTVSLTPEGDGDLEKTARLSGQAGFEERATVYREGTAQVEKEQKEAYARASPAGDLERIGFENVDEPDADLVIRLSAKIHGLVSPLPGGRLEVSPLTMIGWGNPFVEQFRREPILIPYPFVREDTLRVVPPAGYRLADAPATNEVKTAAGRYVVTTEAQPDGSVTIRRQFRLDHERAPAESYPEYRALYAGAARGDAAFSLIFRKAPDQAGGR